MIDLPQEDERAVERLTVQLLQDAYFDVAAVLSAAQPKAAAAILAAIEQRITDVLVRICRDLSEGERSQSIALAVGERLGEIMEQAQGRRVAKVA
jgi:hypothetical protein